MEAAPPAQDFSIIARTQVAITASLDHHELATYDGMLSLFWHHRTESEHRDHQPTTVLFCGGALGGVLGPAQGLFHDLGTAFAADNLADSIRVGYRVPNDRERCVVDVLAAAALAEIAGVSRFVVVGHSFGGAVAIQAGAALAERCAGVVTLATQTADCEPGEELAQRATPVLLIHGDSDTILPFYASQLVHMLTGGELVILPGADHRFTGAGPELRQRLTEWIAARVQAPS